MSSFNKVIIMGNITRDIELRYTPKGTAVTDIGVACNRVRMGDDGNKIEEVTFIDVTLWGRQAELANQYLSKGRSIHIEGRLHMDTWTDQQTGKQRSRLKVIGENMQFVGGAGGGGQQQQQQRPQQAAPQQQQQQYGGAPAQQPQQQYQAPQQPQGGSPAAPMGGDFGDDDDDIPF